MNIDNPTKEMILEMMNHRYMNLSDYREAVSLGRLAPKQLLEDDGRFQQANPEHPLAMDSRMERIDAADTVCFEAKHGDSGIVPLEEIHNHLLDCCPTVRLALVSALVKIGDKSSLGPLRVLEKVEDESDYVKKKVALAIDILENDKKTIFGSSSIYVGDVKDGMAEGEGKLYDSESSVLYYGGEFVNGVYHGLGTLYRGDGSILYKGMFINGKNSSF